MKKYYLPLFMMALLVACQSRPKGNEAVDNMEEDQEVVVDESASNPVPEDNSQIEPPPGGMTIAELIANSKKYDGQTVRVKGRCVKLNNMIMNRNWVHIQDGSLENSEQDLTVTTTDNVALGAIVAFEGKITLNKDFGAGYKYEIIMEDAKLLQ